MRHGQLAAFLCKPLQAHNGRHIHHLEFTKNLCYCCCLDVLSFATLCGLPIGLHVGYTPDLCKRAQHISKTGTAAGRGTLRVCGSQTRSQTCQATSAL
jgi:hypothetical protein